MGYLYLFTVSEFYQAYLSHNYLVSHNRTRHIRLVASCQNAVVTINANETWKHTVNLLYIIISKLDKITEIDEITGASRTAGAGSSVFRL